MLVLISITLFAGVLTRYVFSYSVPELEVLRKFSLLWLVFLGSALAVKEKAHLEIDIFSEYLSETGLKVKNIIVYLLSLFGMIILLFIGIAAYRAGLMRTELVPIRFLPSQPSLIYYYSAFLVGSVFMIYFHLLNAKYLFTRKNEEEVDEE
ncbi:TRAP transporter small permease [Halomonas sp. M5N1S17]|uniref:TRAP transporter small permease n=1 Tax=Halomonas alkalisoli TaxID=2907158 RepID=UPI001F17E05D|nr:TRAP transporter small permease [Halomonas alkalisoli]MCE9663521.1 TRAP transporter small permease [Halomonas alkalisoli]